MQAYYDTHPEEFGRSELRRAAHIRVRTREEADAARARLKELGLDGGLLVTMKAKSQ